ncbi:diaminopimelate epimerase [Helicobacter sp. MIT 21-1697]|uniref:diaminopimelate epimerase n=1 Tax=Helicobacter sp. MIT 21-1697 TaxID=2993733 RepID=UPI00224AC0B4|nr:diaminopimelate epimerase [Helicobacter sp. MIT 21-1697]MCX2716750.1 diaminopimelate epimerase [Helicobacter sp. MIT 21-1697]
MRFVKYSSNGNDFLICHSHSHNDGSRPALARSVCERHNGIGADGMVVLIPAPRGAEYAYEWEFYNADGSSAKMCGNASRSVGHYAYIEGIAQKRHQFLSEVGLIGIELDENDMTLVQSDLGKCKILKQNISESNPYGVKSWDLLDSGVPHLVGFVSQESALPDKKDTLLEHLRHKYDANISLGFIQKDAIKYSTYERGVEDITQACGTGAIAVFAMALKFGLCEKSAILIPPSKDILHLRMNEDSHILFKGAVKRIAVCEWLLES